MNINELAKEVHENAVNHGWWGKPPPLPEALCLIHGELSEALEEYRNEESSRLWDVCLSPDDCDFALTCEENVGHPDAGGKRPEPAAGGIAVERADVILRTLDLMAALGVDVDAVVMAKHRYNLGREYATEGNGYDKLFQSRRRDCLHSAGTLSKHSRTSGGGLPPPRQRPRETIKPRPYASSGGINAHTSARLELAEINREIVATRSTIAGDRPRPRSTGRRRRRAPPRLVYRTQE